MTTMRALFPVKCLIPLDVPQRDIPVARYAVVTWPDGYRQRVAVLYDDALLGETRIRHWLRVGGRAEMMTQSVPTVWLEDGGGA